MSIQASSRNAADRPTITRRRMLRYSRQAALAAGVMLTRSRPATAILNANEKVRIGWIGCGLRCRVSVPAFLSHPDAQIAVLCDVNRPRAEMVRKLTEGTAELYADYRRLLDRKDIDAVVVATPEHWKCLPTIEACQAGKDVYVEKPLARTVLEGRRMVEAARRYNRVVMIGTQQRSMDCYREAIEFIHSGRLGRISEVRAWNFENLAPVGYGRPPDGAPPPGLDWDFWLGPAPRAAYNPNRYHQFHFFWDYGGGWQCDWGVHMFDVIHWAMKVDSPLSATGIGGRFSQQDNTEHPDTFEVVFEYPGFVALYSYRHGNGRPFEGMWYGNAFYGEDGTLLINRDGWQVIPEPRDSHDPSKGLRMGARQGPATPVEGPHQRRFINAVKSRKAPEGADVLTGHRSTVPGHLANISYRTGRKVRWDAGKETIKDDPPANALLGPAYREPWVLPT